MGIEKGGFTVTELEGDPREIHFRTTNEPPSEAQLALKSEVERTLVIIQLLYPARSGKSCPQFTRAFAALLSLAQCGLVGESAQPEVARRALLELRNEITSREAGPTKNRYMRDLGRWAFILGGITSLGGSVFREIRFDSISSLLFIWTGCMAGVWLSFGIRNTSLSFEELVAPESDNLEPSMRLLFTGLISVVLGLLFIKGCITLTLGTLSTAIVAYDPGVALLFGALLGISELALPSKVTVQAAKLLNVQ